MSAQVVELVRRRNCVVTQPMSVPEAAMYALSKISDPGELLRSVAEITGMSEAALRESWGGSQGLWVMAVRRALTMASG